MFNNYFTTEETAKALNVSLFTIRLWLQKGKLTGTKISGIWFVPDEEIERLKRERAPMLKKPGLFKRLIGEGKKRNINA